MINSIPKVFIKNPGKSKQPSTISQLIINNHSGGISPETTNQPSTISQQIINNYSVGSISPETTNLQSTISQSDGISHETTNHPSTISQSDGISPEPTNQPSTISQPDGISPTNQLLQQGNGQQIITSSPTAAALNSLPTEPEQFLNDYSLKRAFSANSLDLKGDESSSKALVEIKITSWPKHQVKIFLL